MPTTTEPPWLNKSSGIAPRNGTTTHVIDFTTDGDAPFTPTNGSLLVVIVAGSVTHTVSSGGWTEHLQPVSSAELSVFSVTVSGHTTISVVHNGSNYPAGYCVMELPAGTTYTSGVSDSGSGDSSPFPTLSSLPGTEQLIIAARGRGISTAVITTGQSTVWDAPFVEDYDHLEPPSSPTDSYYITVAHAINQTATSITPGSTTTVLGQSGANDRQQVVFALDAVAPSGGTTPVDSSLDLRWKVQNTVPSALDARWRVRAIVGSDLDLRWRVRNQVASGMDARWRVRSVVSSTLDARWALRAAVSASLDLRWRQFALASSSVHLLWVSEGAPLSDEVLRSSVTASLTDYVAAHVDQGNVVVELGVL